jgi:hypothetical protein
MDACSLTSVLYRTDVPGISFGYRAHLQIDHITLFSRWMLAHWLLYCTDTVDMPGITFGYRAHLQIDHITFSRWMLAHWLLYCTEQMCLVSHLGTELIYKLTTLHYFQDDVVAHWLYFTILYRIRRQILVFVQIHAATFLPPYHSWRAKFSCVTPFCAVIRRPSR